MVMRKYERWAEERYGTVWTRDITWMSQYVHKGNSIEYTKDAQGALNRSHTVCTRGVT